MAGCNHRPAVRSALQRTVVAVAGTALNAKATCTDVGRDDTDVQVRATARHRVENRDKLTEPPYQGGLLFAQSTRIHDDDQHIKRVDHIGRDVRHGRLARKRLALGLCSRGARARKAPQVTFAGTISGAGLTVAARARAGAARSQGRNEYDAGEPRH